MQLVSCRESFHQSKYVYLDHVKSAKLSEKMADTEAITEGEVPEEESVEDEDFPENTTPTRRLNDKEKIRLIADLKMYPSLWRNTSQFSRTDRTNATQMLSAKFSLVPDNLKKIIHFLRASMLREIRRSNDDSDYEST